tara:strand:+ start:96 stop:1799 length:1704 start_codon:yes stop_codon:yes gene_type:complete
VARQTVAKLRMSHQHNNRTIQILTPPDFFTEANKSTPSTSFIDQFHHTYQVLQQHSMSSLASNISDEDRASAEECKVSGNEHFTNARYPQAASSYSDAISKNPLSAVYFSNRAATYLKMEQFGLAQQDAKQGMAVDPKYIKSYYRLASSYMALGKFKQAKKIYKWIVKNKPKSKDARKKLKACQEQVTKEIFEASIRTERGAPLSETFNVHDLVVPDSYKGPRLEPETEITDAFVRELCEWQRGQQQLHRKYMVVILLRMLEYMRHQPSLVEAKFGARIDDATEEQIKEASKATGIVSTADFAPHFNVCGDTHGQYYDLLNIFENVRGWPSPNNPYLFNGDYVDRGSFSVEVVTTLFSYKLLYPNSFFLSRGNHEGKQMNKMYGFEGEVKHKYDQTVMTFFSEVFNWLPLYHTINSKIFVVHGGLFQQDGVTLDQLKAVQRNCEPPESGLMSDALWSDPQPFKGRGPSKRGVGLTFGPDVTKSFLDLNGLNMLVRSHEVKDEGYLVEHDGRLCTIFSAPNYCDQMGNKGAVIAFEPKNCVPTYHQFTHVDHPPIRPMAYAGQMSMFH